jgi:hypothetical protein
MMSLRNRLPLERMQLLACEAIFLAFFLSVWKYKLWYIATMGAFVLTALVAAIPAVKIRGLLTDVAPLVVYFAYLYVAGGWSEFAAEARWWALADSIGIFVFAVFWVAARNNDAATLILSFVRVSLLMVITLVVTYNPSPYASRFGGYTLQFIPAALPFLWTAIVRGMRRVPASVAMAVCLVVLLISRSRAPLATGIIVFGLSMLLIGRSLGQRIKLAAALSLAGIVIGGLLLAYTPTRILLLTFFSRITRKDVLTSDIYIAAENDDPIRGQLRDLVHEHILDVQPFGAGYMVTQRLYERVYPEPYTLHDIYQTWAFEGGVICVVIVGVILLRNLRGLAFARRFAFTRDDAVVARCIELATLAALIAGLFHQLHHGPMLYSALGLGLGWRARIRDQHLQVPHVARHIPAAITPQRAVLA